MKLSLLAMIALVTFLIATPSAPLKIVLGDTVKGPSDDNGKI